MLDRVRRLARVGLGALVLTASSNAQDLPPSGIRGLDLVWATSPTGSSQLFAVSSQNLLAFPIHSPVDNLPSRWAHRRRTLGALETQITGDTAAGVLLTPMGDQSGAGAIHFLDTRLGVPLASQLVPTSNPPAYDIAIIPSLQVAFSVEDNGFDTTLRGFSYATPGQLLPLSPPSLNLPGRPAAYVNRIGVDEANGQLHVPTASGIQIISVQAAVPQMSAGPFVVTGAAAPATNPSTFLQLGTRVWVMGTTTFDGNGKPNDGGWISWNNNGAATSGTFGQIPNLSPPRNYVPAVGAEELAVVGNGTNTWVYYPLRDPSPTAFFVRPSAIGVVRYLGAQLPVSATLTCPDNMGEPFAIPSVHGTRVAIESSLGPPFSSDPPGGAEKISILYSPLDPLGSGTAYGRLGVPGPLGGRISTKGMDRPIWTRDGSRVIAFTSHFPGAPNPARPGIEVLDVPAGQLLDELVTPHTVVENPTSPNQSIIYPSSYRPRDPAAAPFLDTLGISLAGNVFHDGMAAALTLPFGEVGQKQIAAPLFTQSSEVPNFPGILPPSFEDATAPLVPIPGQFGARRTAFNKLPGLTLIGVTMVFAIDDTIRLQPTGANALAALGFGFSQDPIVLSLPTGFVTTSELFSY